MLPRPVHSSRWQLAQASQRRYQDRKARSLSGREAGLLRAAAVSSARAHAWVLEKAPGFEPEAVAEIGSGAHGLIWCWPGSARRIAVDPLAGFYRRRFGFLQDAVRDVLQARGERLPLQDACVDLVLSDNVLDHVEDPALFMKELARVLRPGGLLYLTVHFSHPVWSVATRMYNGIHRLGVELWVPGFPSHPFSFRRRELLGLFRATGYEVVALESPLPSLPRRLRRVRRLRDVPKVLAFKDATLRVLLRRPPVATG